jgi:hypothetical protein
MSFRPGWLMRFPPVVHYKRTGYAVVVGKVEAIIPDITQNTRKSRILLLIVHQ